jgi:hypothetical protein
MFNFCTGWTSVISYFSRPVKELPVATGLEAVGLRDITDAVESKKPAPLPVIESRFPTRPSRSVVTFMLATLTLVHNKQQRLRHIAGQFTEVHDSDNNKNTRTLRHTVLKQLTNNCAPKNRQLAAQRLMRLVAGLSPRRHSVYRQYHSTDVTYMLTNLTPTT